MDSPASAPIVHAPFLRWDAHHRLLVSAGVAGLVFVFLYGHASLVTGTVAGWDIFALIDVALAWFALAGADPYEARRTARLQDGSRTFLFIVVIGAALASLLAAGALLGLAKDAPRTQLGGHLGLSVATVGISWMLVHTLFALRYAHNYYDDARTVAREKIDGGLIFPGEASPGYLDFAYFSFVVGMTCQVSDVQVAATDMRRLTLVHGLIAFAFNTAILAMFVNIVAGLL